MSLSPKSASEANRSGGVKAPVNSWYPALMRKRECLLLEQLIRNVFTSFLWRVSVNGINSTRWPFDLLPSRGCGKVSKARDSPVHYKGSWAESYLELWMETQLHSSVGTKVPRGRSKASGSLSGCTEMAEFIVPFPVTGKTTYSKKILQGVKAWTQQRKEGRYRRKLHRSSSQWFGQPQDQQWGRQQC